MPFITFFTFTNYPTIIILLCLTFFFLKDHTFPSKIIRKFLWLVSCIACLMLVDAGYVYFSTFSTYSTGKLLFTCLGYIFRPLCLSIIITITMRYSKHKGFLFFIPTIFNSIISILNFFFPIIFYIDQNNQFHRFYFCWLPYAVNFSMIILVLINLSQLRKSNPRSLTILKTNLHTNSNMLKFKHEKIC